MIYNKQKKTIKKLSITLANNNYGNVPKRSVGSTAPNSIPSSDNKDVIQARMENIAKQNCKVTAFQLRDITEDLFEKTWGQIESSETKKLGMLGFGQLLSSIKEREDFRLIQSSGYNRVQFEKINESSPKECLKSINTPLILNKGSQQKRQEQTLYSKPIQYWFSCSSSFIFSDKYQRPMLRQVYAKKSRQD